MSSRIIRPLFAVALLGASSVLVAACSSSSVPAAVRTSAARPHMSSPSPAAGVSSSQAAALAAYRAMWNDVAKASNTADYQAPYLANHLADSALVTITDNLAVEHTQGVVAYGAPLLHPLVTSAMPTTVLLSDCLDDHAWLQYFAATNKLVNDTPGGLRSTTVTVSERAGVWKVTQLNTGTDGSCTLGR